VSEWYTERPAEKVALQVIKYRQRDTWTHRDVLRLAHPTAPTPEHDAIFEWVTQGNEPGHGVSPLIDAYLAVNRETSSREIQRQVRENRLPREALPTDSLKDPAIWDALLDDMPMTAMIRNLGVMSRVGLLTPGSNGTATVVTKLADTDALRRSRVHPLQVLTAMATYASGQGFRSRGAWNPVVQIVDALDEAFYLSFENVEPTNLRYLLALDVSSSMGGGQVAGTPMTPRMAASAMAMVTARTEKRYEAVAFQRVLESIPLSPRQRLDDVMRIPWHGGGTDCALPMIYAEQNAREVDVFVVYTDSETWAGNVHPAQALASYRRASGIDARLIVVVMVSNGFSIADPNDRGMLDVVGFDASVPRIMSEFALGRV